MSERARQRLSLTLTVCAGAAVSIQTFSNGHLSDALGSPFLAAAVNNLSALTLVGVLAVVSGALPRAVRAIRRRQHPISAWWFVGGVLGAAAVSSNSFAEPHVGVALVTVALVLGQLTGSLIADLWGLGPAGRKGITGQRIAGMLIAAVAVGVGAFGRTGELHLGVLLVVMLGGAAAALQQAGNGQLTRLTGEPLAMAVVNFSVGFVALTVLIVAGGAAGTGEVWDAMPGWAWVGGAVGAGVAVVLAVAVRTLGVLQVMLGVVAGQSIAAVALDLASPRDGISVTVGTVVGVALACLAMAVAAEKE